MSSDEIGQFLSKDTLDALQVFITSDDVEKAISAAVKTSDAFGAGPAFQKIADDQEESEGKLIESFHKNLVLLIQKTWVEKSDEELKAQVLYHLEEFNEEIKEKSYEKAYKSFFGIVSDVVYLMFGNQTKTKDFDQYALRIDPEFGIFWWYITSLPQTAQWPAEKYRIAILLGIYFLANY